MAEGMKKRTKYSLHRNIPVEIPAGFDQLCDPEGAQIINAAGEPTVDGVVGPSPSTLFSAVGSFCALGWFAAFMIMIGVAFEKDPPTINQMSLDVDRDFSAPFPDFAVTFSITPRHFYVANQIRQIKAAHGSSKTWIEAEFEARDQWKLLSEDEQNVYACEKHKCESRTLEYLWPVFRWESISDGYVEKTDVHTLLGPEDGLHFGDDCGLSASYNAARDGRWPVFCFLNSKLPPEKQRRLRGRDYGDPIWSFLDLRIVRCTNMSAAEVEREKGYTNVSMPFPEAWSGNCAPHGDIDALLDYEYGLPVNMFFNLSSEPDWTKSRWDEPDVPMRPPEENGMVGPWTFHVFEKMSSSSAMQCRLYLKHTEAMINWPLSLGFETLRKLLSLGRAFKEKEDYDPYRWFEYDRTECQREYIDDARFEEMGSLYRWDLSGHVMGENRTRFFDIDVRMHNKRRSLLVRRQNRREMLSEISGSWEISLGLGWLVVVVINHALKAASACPRSREEAKAVWTQAYGRGAPKVATADAAPAPAPATEVPAPVVEAAAPAAEASVRNLLSVRSRSSSRLVVPESPAPPLDPRKFAELMERVKELAERVEELENRRPESHK